MLWPVLAKSIVATIRRYIKNLYRHLNGLFDYFATRINKIDNVCSVMVVVGGNGRDVWRNEIHGDNKRKILLTCYYANCPGYLLTCLRPTYTRQIYQHFSVGVKCGLLLYNVNKSKMPFCLRKRKAMQSFGEVGGIGPNILTSAPNRSGQLQAPASLLPEKSLLAI